MLVVSNYFVSIHPMAQVLVSPDGEAADIRRYIREHPDIRKEEYASDDDALLGSCYVAAEAYYHARGGTDSDLDIYCLSWSDVDETFEGTHWFLREGRFVFDLSLPDSTYASGIPWDVARKRAFLTGYEPSKRCRRVLDDLGIDYE